MCYPNPTADILYIDSKYSEYSNYSKYSIFDNSGKLIKNGVLDGSGIDVSKLASGAYVIKIETEKGVVMERFVKR
jgi:hypothetical protein